jgi:hypothetical protein
VKPAHGETAQEEDFTFRIVIYSFFQLVICEIQVECETEVVRNMCCKLGCEASAQWRIYDGEKPDDYTEACTAHVGDLLSDAPEHRIYPI